MLNGSTSNTWSKHTSPGKLSMNKRWGLYERKVAVFWSVISQHCFLQWHFLTAWIVIRTASHLTLNAALLWFTWNILLSLMSKLRYFKRLQSHLTFYSMCTVDSILFKKWMCFIFIPALISTCSHKDVRPHALAPTLIRVQKEMAPQLSRSLIFMTAHRFSCFCLFVDAGEEIAIL